MQPFLPALEKATGGAVAIKKEAMLLYEECIKWLTFEIMKPSIDKIKDLQ